MIYPAMLDNSSNMHQGHAEHGIGQPAVQSLSQSFPYFHGWKDLGHGDTEPLNLVPTYIDFRPPEANHYRREYIKCNMPRMCSDSFNSPDCVG